MNADSGDDDRGPEGSRNDAEETPTAADVEAIQDHLCRRSAAALSDDPSDDHLITIR
jgi:hypothetical protein